MTTMTGRVALVTGASRGIGRAIARGLAARGAVVVAAARGDHAAGVAAEIVQDGGRAESAALDVTDAAAVQAVVGGLLDRLGRIDILVNNAGIILVAPIENTTVADFDRALQTMFWGVVHPTLAVLPEMKERGYGRIVTITSVGGKVSVPHLNAYSCAKAAAVAFCEGLHAELAPHGIHVTTIAPGLMRTGGHVNAVYKGDKKSEERWFRLAATMPVLTMSAQRAARQTVDAVKHGTAVKVLSTQANLLARANGAFPGLVPSLMTLVARLLPAPSPST